MSAIVVEPAHLSHAACACIDERNRIDHSLAYAARTALFSPDPWDAQYRDDLALQSLAWDLEFKQLRRDRERLEAAA